MRCNYIDSPLPVKGKAHFGVGFTPKWNYLKMNGLWADSTFITRGINLIHKMLIYDKSARILLGGIVIIPRGSEETQHLMIIRGGFWGGFFWRK